MGSYFTKIQNLKKNREVIMQKPKMLQEKNMEDEDISQKSKIFRES